MGRAPRGRRCGLTDQLSPGVERGPVKFDLIQQLREALGEGFSMQQAITWASSRAAHLSFEAVRGWSVPTVIAERLDRTRSVWEVEAECFAALLNTETPPLDPLPRLPYQAVEVLVPASEHLSEPASVCVTEDVYRDEPVLLFFVPGGDTALHGGIAVVQQGLVDDQDGLHPIIRGTLNLLCLLHDNALRADPVRFPEVRSAKKLAKLERQGRTLNPVTVISLTGTTRSRPAPPAGSSGHSVRAHVRRGHWKRFWVLDPEGRRVLATKQGKGGQLHQVAKWIRPHVVGKGEPSQRTYRVKS